MPELIKIIMLLYTLIWFWTNIFKYYLESAILLKFHPRLKYFRQLFLKNCKIRAVTLAPIPIRLTRSYKTSVHNKMNFSISPKVNLNLKNWTFGPWKSIWIGLSWEVRISSHNLLTDPKTIFLFNILIFTQLKTAQRCTDTLEIENNK